jgi:hypothetical protein
MTSIEIKKIVANFCFGKTQIVYDTLKAKLEIDKKPSG